MPESSGRGCHKGDWILHVVRRAFPDLCELLTSDLKLQRFSSSELLKLLVVVTAFPAALFNLFFFLNKGTGDF